MRVLMVTEALPYLPTRERARLAPAALLAHLASRHALALVAPEGSLETPPQRQWAVGRGIRVLLAPGGPLRGPLWGGPAAGLTALAAAVKNAVRSWAPDVVHLDGLRLAPLAGQLSVPAVLVCREPGVRHAREARHLAGGLLAWVGAGLQECREASWARRWLPAARLCIVPCEADRRALARYLPFEQLEVVPPGIDTELYGVRRGSRRPRLVFAGTLARPGHAQAAWRLATRVLPGVRRALPSAELLVADAGSAPTLRALAALPGVRVSSATPDLRPTLWTAATVLVPAEAGPGVEAALLEAMALGTPVVSAHAGLDGLDHVLPGRHVLVAESDAEMTDAALLLMREPVVATTLAAGARQVVERRYTHAAASQCYEALWARAAEAAPRAVAA